VFKARTWEEIKMLANENKYIKDTVVTMYQMSEDEKIKEQCLASDLYHFDLASAKNKGYKDGVKDGHASGLKEGHAAGLWYVISNMLKDNKDTVEISKATGIPIETVTQLINNNK
jgi:flagellar biosynthesis/type III secretory pathway protein FliH